jgi:pimeloyl-ACP methyl ester carboxylesterase
MVPLARHLAGDFRVYAPDLPGFGDSGKPREVLDVPGLADALAAWVRAAGLAGRRVAPIGNSFGCQIIADLAARHPDLVDRAVLQGPTTPPDERSWVRQFVVWRRNQPHNPPSLSPVTWRDYRKAGVRRLFHTFRHQLGDRIEDKLPRIRSPVLVVRGRLDPICRLPWATEVARLLPDGRLAEIPGVAHTLCYTAPVELAAVSRMFLDDEGASTAAGRRPGRPPCAAAPAPPERAEARS